MSGERLAARFDVALEVAILLLEVLRLEKQPLGPNDLIRHRHSHQLDMQEKVWPAVAFSGAT
jgi:hypothetical protein